MAEWEQISKEHSKQTSPVGAKSLEIRVDEKNNTLTSNYKIIYLSRQYLIHPSWCLPVSHSLHGNYLLNTIRLADGEAF